MSILRSVLSVILVVTLARAVPLQKNADVPEDRNLNRATDIKYRLPSDVVPSYYVIKLEPNIVVDSFTFKGETTIKIKVLKKDTKKITLHAKDLKFEEGITSLTPIDETKAAIKPTSHKLIEKYDFLELDFSKTPLAAGEYNLYLKFSGVLNDELNGFYRSSYINDKGEKIWLATTQFEPTHARRAFPCFDEPALKAEFEISIKHLEHYKATSNMPIASIMPDSASSLSWWTHFKVTPLMSTYLLAFVVSDFSYLTTDDGKFRVWARSNAIHTGEYAQELGQKELKFLEDYTGIKHKIPKMDNFAIPQLRAGAMENWGLVTYRESGLLYEENVTTIDSKQGIATVISHEFAHQWFGNLVGPEWWKYAWLNEGFANYFQFVITEKAEDNWRLMDQFVIKNLQETAFTADGIEDQHPMNVEVNSPEEISKIFDSISYSKAGCVIRMTSHALTEKVFQSGLQKYLKDRQLKEANSDHLFNSLSAVAKDLPKGVDLKKVLDLWANQRGYPVITVIRDHKTGKASVSQVRYISKKTTEEPPKELWWIPINFATQDKLDFEQTTPTQWLEPVTKSVSLTGTLKTNNWIIVNKQQTGYYRVNYDDTNWKLIANFLKSKNYTKIHVLNRAQLLDDSFNFAQTGELSDFSVFLDISTYLQQEDDYVPWYAAFRAFSVLNKALINTDKYDLFKLYLLRLIEKLEKSVGFEETAEDDHVTKFNRVNAINWGCTVGSVNCRSATHSQLLNHINGTNKVAVNLRNVVFCGAIRTASVSTWAEVFDFYKSSKVEAERNALINALGCTSDEIILKAYLAQTLDPDSTNSWKTVVKAVYQGSDVGVTVAYDFVTENVAALIKLDEGNNEAVVTALNAIGSKFTTQAQVDKLDKFITDHKDLADALKSQALVNAKSNVAWVKTYGPKIGTFLNEQKLVTEKIPTTEKPGSNSSPNLVLPALPLTIFLVFIVNFVTRF